MSSDEKDESDSVADEAVSVLRDQVRDLQKQVSDYKSNYDRMKRSKDTYKKQVDDITKERDKLNEILDSYPTPEEIEIISDKITEWEPLVQEYESSKTSFSNLVQERDEIQGELDALKVTYQDTVSQANELRAQVALPPDEANQRLAQTQEKLDRIAHEQAWREGLSQLTDSEGNHVSLQPKVASG